MLRLPKRFAGVSLAASENASPPMDAPAMSEPTSMFMFCRTKITPNTSEEQVTALRGEFESCAIKCCDTDLARLPNIRKKIDETIKSGKF